jgi:hypothetical protein
MPQSWASRFRDNKAQCRIARIGQSIQITIGLLIGKASPKFRLDEDNLISSTVDTCEIRSSEFFLRL